MKIRVHSGRSLLWVFSVPVRRNGGDVAPTALAHLAAQHAADHAAHHGPGAYARAANAAGLLDLHQLHIGHAPLLRIATAGVARLAAAGIAPTGIAAGRIAPGWITASGISTCWISALLRIARAGAEQQRGDAAGADGAQAMNASHGNLLCTVRGPIKGSHRPGLRLHTVSTPQAARVPTGQNTC
jgi:hypothetical protein